MATQSEKILELLEIAGDKGVENYRLNDIAYRYSARLHELKKQGYDIQAKHIEGSRWKFILKPKQATLFKEVV